MSWRLTVPCHLQEQLPLHKVTRFFSVPSDTNNFEVAWTISMGWWKKNVTPLLTRWSYVFLALTHRCNPRWAKRSRCSLWHCQRYLTQRYIRLNIPFATGDSVTDGTAFLDQIFVIDLTCRFLWAISFNTFHVVLNEFFMLNKCHVYKRFIFVLISTPKSQQLFQF